MPWVWVSGTAEWINFGKFACCCGGQVEVLLAIEKFVVVEEGAMGDFSYVVRNGKWKILSLWYWGSEWVAVYLHGGREKWDEGRSCVFAGSRWCILRVDGCLDELDVKCGELCLCIV